MDRSIGCFKFNAATGGPQNVNVRRFRAVAVVTAAGHTAQVAAAVVAVVLATAAVVVAVVVAMLVVDLLQRWVQRPNWRERESRKKPASVQWTVEYLEVSP